MSCLAGFINIALRLTPVICTRVYRRLCQATHVECSRPMGMDDTHVQQEDTLDVYSD